MKEIKNNYLIYVIKRIKTNIYIIEFIKNKNYAEAIEEKNSFYSARYFYKKYEKIWNIKDSFIKIDYIIN